MEMDATTKQNKTLTFVFDPTTGVGTLTLRWKAALTRSTRPLD